jgi:arylsulfatase A-like enzyme
MVRDERWKLIQYRAAGSNNTQLFDLANDPDELRNLAKVDRITAERERLEKLMRRARQEFGDPVDFDKPVAASSKP